MEQKGIVAAAIGGAAVLTAAAITSVDKWMPLITGRGETNEDVGEPTTKRRASRPTQDPGHRGSPTTKRRASRPTQDQRQRPDQRSGRKTARGT